MGSALIMLGISFTGAILILPLVLWGDRQPIRNPILHLVGILVGVIAFAFVWVYGWMIIFVWIGWLSF